MAKFPSTLFDHQIKLEFVFDGRFMDASFF